MTAGIERLLVTYSVDLVITGHLHTYQRSCHVAKGNCFDRPSGGGIAKACEGVALDPVTEAKCKAKEWVRDKADEVEAKTQKLLSAKAGGGGGVASTAPQRPARRLRRARPRPAGQRRLPRPRPSVGGEAGLAGLSRHARTASEKSTSPVPASP